MTMKFFDKIKNIFKNNQTSTQTTPASSINTPHPITTHIKNWLDGQQWHYEHRTPSDKDSQIHHLILSFADQQSDWTCVFRINEQNQLVAIFGVLPDTVPLSHYAPMMMKVAQANLNIAWGSIELDPSDGEVRTKMSVDAEFDTLSDKALGCYLHGVANLTETAQRLFHETMSESEPSPLLYDYLENSSDEQLAGTETEGGFFIPTQSSQ